MRTPPADEVGVTFVNTVVARGILNGVVNVAFATFNFSPDMNEKGEMVVDTDPVISSRLRMDVPCARQLHEALGTLLDSIDHPAPSISSPTNEGVASGKPN